MFTSPKRNDMQLERPPQNEVATVIAHGVRVDGDFTSQGDVIIEGEVHGNVSASGSLTVGSQARLKADIKAERAVIAGTVEGDVTVTTHLELKSTGKISGNITCETASVEAGAALNGTVAIGQKAVPALSSPAKGGSKASAAARENVSAE